MKKAWILVMVLTVLFAFNAFAEVPPDCDPATYGDLALDPSFVLPPHCNELPPVPETPPELPPIPQALCSAVPTVTAAINGPDTVRVRNHKMLNVGISATATVSSGCTIGDVWFEMNDEYGQLSGSGPMTLVDGNYVGSVDVEASRDGQDEDGRKYEITVFASDEAGIGTSGTYFVQISHDAR